MQRCSQTKCELPTVVGWCLVDSGGGRSQCSREISALLARESCKFLQRTTGSFVAQNSCSLYSHSNLHYKSLKAVYGWVWVIFLLWVHMCVWARACVMVPNHFNHTGNVNSLWIKIYQKVAPHNTTEINSFRLGSAPFPAFLASVYLLP